MLGQTAQLNKQNETSLITIHNKIYYVLLFKHVYLKKKAMAKTVLPRATRSKC